MIDSFALKQDNYNFLGVNGRIIGNVETKGPTIIQGAILGNILAKNNAELKIEKLGVVQGDLDCFDLFVYGTIRGEIKSKGKVILFPSAIIEGNIEASELKIHPGASVNGSIKTSKKGQ